MTDQINQMLANAGAPAWVTANFVLIAAGVLLVLLLLFVLNSAARGRARALEEASRTPQPELVPPARPITPPVTPTPEPEPMVQPAPPVIVTAPPAPPVVQAPPEPVRADPEPQVAPEPLADEPIAAAAPLDASPASIAADEPPAPVVAAESAPEPAPAAPSPATELTTLKGVGPRLADRLKALGIASLADIAALTPEGADALDAQLGDFKGRIHRDRWIEQAGYLASGDISGFEKKFGKL